MPSIHPDGSRLGFRTLLVVGVALSMLAVPSALADNGESVDADQAPVGAMDELGVGQGWHYFSWFGSGTVFAQDTFEYTSESPTELRVTDAFCYGDQFQIYDNGAPVAVTTEPGSDVCGGPWSGQNAYEDDDMSSGCVILPPGAHTIEIEVIENPFGGGGAYIKADQVPEDPVDCIEHYRPPLPGNLPAP